MAKKNAIGPKAVRLLRKVAKHILAEPLRYDQNEVLVKVIPGRPFTYSHLEGTRKSPSCGTIGCLAGWVTALSLTEKRALTVDPIDYAANKLGLTLDQKRALFGNVHQWPTQFVLAYQKAGNPRKIAQVAVKRIEHFIKTGE